MEADFDARVNFTTAWMMALMSTFDDDAEGGMGGAWGARTMDARAAKDGIEEATGEVWYHEGRGDCSREDRGDEMPVIGGRLLGSWIQRSAEC